MPQPDAILNPMDDAAALRTYARSGDPDAFAVLIHRYGAMVLATCRRTLRNDADAEDAAQDTFVKLARHAADIRQNAGAWLHAAAMTTSVDLIRRRGAQRRAESKSEPRAEAHNADVPAWADIEPKLDAALEELSEADRDLLVARFLAGRSLAEIAQAAGISEGAASRRTKKALDRLRTALAGSGLAVASAVWLEAALVPAHPAALTPESAATLGKVGLTGIGAKSSSGSVVSKLLTGSIIGIGVTTAVVLAVVRPGMLGTSAQPETTPTARAAAAPLPLGPARPTNRVGPFTAVSAYDDAFADRGMVISPNGIAIATGYMPETGEPRRAFIRTVRTEPIDPSNPDAGVMLDSVVDWITPIDDTWSRFKPGQRLKISVKFDDWDRIVIREQDDLVQIGRNEPTWYGVRPPKGWPEHGRILLEGFPLAVGGERIPLNLSPNEIRLGTDSWAASRFRIIEWERAEGFSRVLAIEAGGRNPYEIGTRFKLLIRKEDDGYSLGYFEPGTPRGQSFPSSFEFTPRNPLKILRFREGR